jgi:hypothetical protein|tara:strand:- start:731 stop:934 length:204 start_codon:yes stop_codon:yes gene_type:complete
MSAQLKKINLEKENVVSKSVKETQRPNIDHLVRRIMIERRREKIKSVTMLGATLLTFAIAAFFFTKG